MGRPPNGWNNVSDMLSYSEQVIFHYGDDVYPPVNKSLGAKVMWSAPAYGRYNQYHYYANYINEVFSDVIEYPPGLNLTVISVRNIEIYYYDYKAPESTYLTRRYWRGRSEVMVRVNDQHWVTEFTYPLIDAEIIAWNGAPVPAGLNAYFEYTGIESANYLNGVGATIFEAAVGGPLSLEQAEALYVGLQRNFADYEPPAYCNAAFPGDEI